MGKYSINNQDLQIELMNISDETFDDDEDEHITDLETSFHPEHFDSDSVLTKSTGGDTYMTKSHQYKYAESTTTVQLQSPQFLKNISKHFAKNTTLLHLACKTKSWGIVKAILSLNLS